jgi:predicted Zn-dependent protease with MMP-like domain
MRQDEFEDIVEEAFHNLPAVFKDAIDNVEIIVEDQPNDAACRSVKSSRESLLGLYHGVPLTQRGSWYGASPVLPDRITLYRKNIERLCSTDDEIRTRIYEVLCHEVGHYFGMNERQIRTAMRSWENK